MLASGSSYKEHVCVVFLMFVAPAATAVANSTVRMPPTRGGIASSQLDLICAMWGFLRTCGKSYAL